MKIPTKERYAKMTEEQKKEYRQYSRNYYKKTKGLAQKTYQKKHRKELREIAYFEYHENPKVREQSKKRAMKSYRKAHPEVKLVRARKNGEPWPSKQCPNCMKTFTPNTKEQVYCSQKCYFNHKGYLNLLQYQTFRNKQRNKQSVR